MTERSVTEILAGWRNDDWTEAAELDSITTISPMPMIVIGGCARSGTTLLRVMLDTHSSVVCGPHSNLFIPVPLDLEKLSFKFEISTRRLQDMRNNSRNRVEFIEAFAKECQEMYGKPIWAEKTARNVHRFWWIRQHFPNAKLIHVVRDGRDVVCSLRTHEKHRIVEDQIERTGYVMPLKDCAERWVRAVEAGTKVSTYRNYYEVRYENLITKTTETLTELCNWLDIPFEGDMLKYHAVQGQLRDPLKFPQTIEAAQPMYSTAMGRWQRDLSDADYSFVLQLIGSQLDKLGYV